MTQQKPKLVRVGMNLPETLVNQVKEYGESLGVNTTSAYIFLLNQALQQKDMFANLPAMVSVLKELNKYENMNKELENKGLLKNNK